MIVNPSDTPSLNILRSERANSSYLQLKELKATSGDSGRLASKGEELSLQSNNIPFE
jgi:hypothetical protein